VSIFMMWDCLTLELIITASGLLVALVGTLYPTCVLFFDIFVQFWKIPSRVVISSKQLYHCTGKKRRSAGVWGSLFLQLL
jgi:hypothetical protein